MARRFSKRTFQCDCTLAAEALREPNAGNAPFLLLHSLPDDTIEGRWRACLANSDFPTHYTAPEYFLEPMLRKTRGFAILSIENEEVTGVLTGINDGDHVQSGLSVRPQIALSRRADRHRAMDNLIAGLLAEARRAKLIDLFVWPDMGALVGQRFGQRLYEGVVMLNLSHGPDELFRQFSQTKRNEIRRAIKSGVSVGFARDRSEVSGYYRVYLDWSCRKAISFVAEDEFQELFALTKNRRLLLARYDGQIIAGAVVRFVPGGVAEYAANSSLESGLHLRPNDLLQWRAIEWACAEGMTRYSLGGTHLFLRKFGGEVVPTKRCRLDLSAFRRFALVDWAADRVRPLIPDPLAALARPLQILIQRPRARKGRTST